MLKEISSYFVRFIKYEHICVHCIAGSNDTVQLKYKNGDKILVEIALGNTVS
jgi:formylmethanofuran dehydrogenase subunit D